MSDVVLIRNPKTGEVEAFRDGEFLGEVTTMGDLNLPEDQKG